MPKDTKEFRDLLRKATLGTAVQFKSETITINDQEFEVKQPSLKERRAIQQKCIIMGEEGIESIDISELMVWSVIRCTFVPGTDVHVFDPEDYEALINRPTGGFMDELSALALKMMNLKADDASPEKNLKGSDQTRSSKPSTH